MSDGSENVGLEPANPRRGRDGTSISGPTLRRPAGAQRSSLAITISVWKALFIRESLARLFSARGTWLWVLAEPIFHVAYILVLYTVVRVHSVGGIDTTVWITAGMLAFFMFRRTAMQVMNSVDANQALFTYRQVKPIDTALVRAGVEGLLMSVVAALVFSGAAMLGHNVMPADPLAVTAAFATLWLLGLGFGLVVSVATQLVPELGRIVRVAMMPLYFISGVMFHVALAPVPYRDWLMLNPVAHGLEAARLGFAPYYHAASELSIAYMFVFALAMVCLGLALQRRFALRLVTR